MSNLTMDKLVNLCKSRGFIFQGSEIYGGMGNTWDYGPVGTELINNLRYGEDTTLMAESEELKSLLIKMKEESEKLA